jgi:thiamine-phosphate pyrophosphorylase
VMGRAKRPFLETDIYAITAAGFSKGRSNTDVVREILEAGVRVIQYREKDFSMLEKYRECVSIREMTSKHGATFIVNDDVDLALAVGADGVHVGQDDLPAEKVRELVGEDMLIGLSTHTPGQIDAAVGAGIVDYVGVGPLYGTAIKKVPMAAVGLGYLDYVVQHHNIPFVAIGGIKEHNVAEVVSHGASCVCLVSDIVGAPDIGEKIRGIRRRIEEAKRLRDR